MSDWNAAAGDAALALGRMLGAQLLRVVAYPLEPEQRIFALYLVSALLLALLVYVRAMRAGSREGTATLSGFFGFLFPRAVWSNPSAWLDVRYFFFHQMVRLVIYGSLLTGAMAVTFHLFAAHVMGVDVQSTPQPQPQPGGMAAEFAFVVAAALAIDLVSYVIHLAQHKLPMLWEFHKVHHSATVMHPLTNYREHPVDNVAYALGTGITTGVLAAVFVAHFGRPLEGPTILGVGALMFAFNFFGYNLRHSHVWLKWRPNALNYVFGSPAHHQVHHSCHPDHIDKNFAFMTPLWDVIFRTYCMPATNADIRFGLDEGEPKGFSSCLGLYFTPFRNVARYLFAGWGSPIGTSGRRACRPDPGGGDAVSAQPSRPSVAKVADADRVA